MGAKPKRDPNAWKVGLRRLIPGVYVDADEAMHIDAEELLTSQGYPASEHNEATLRKVLGECCKKIGVKVEDV